jgi:hypothetical protein
MKRLYIIAVLFLFAVAVQAFADPQSQFEEGLVQYRSDNWELAVTVWESLLDQGYDSGPLQYNLGNASGFGREVQSGVCAIKCG